MLMQLRKLYPNIELHGINKRPWPAMKGQESLKRTATLYKIFTKQELKKVNLPRIHFYKARKLNFRSNYFDLIYSQVAMHYIDRKDILIEDIWRVLRKGGKALLHFDTVDKTYADFLQFETPRFIMRKKGKIYPIKELVRDIRKKGYDISIKKSSAKKEGIMKHSTYLIISKNKNTPLKLNLRFDPVSSFELSILNKDDKDCTFWGYRSVYNA